jgi:HSP20 family molecular chaperone IbpA
MTQELTPRPKKEAPGQEETRSTRFYVPDVDIWEDDAGLTLLADMPGVAPGHVSVELNDQVLSLEGEIALSDYEGLSPVYTEYSVGHFQRRFSLPFGDRYDRNRVEASLRNGVLEVKVPRSAAARPRRIPVSTV